MRLLFSKAVREFLAGTVMGLAAPAEAQAVNTLPATSLVDQFKIESLIHKEQNIVTVGEPVTKDRKASVSVQVGNEIAAEPQDNLRAALHGPLGDNGKYKIGIARITATLRFK